MVKSEKILLIKKEFQDGKSKTQIAEDLKTVDKYFNRDDFNEKVEVHVKGFRESKLDPYKPEIDEMFENSSMSFEISSFLSALSCFFGFFAILKLLCPLLF